MRADERSIIEEEIATSRVYSRDYWLAYKEEVVKVDVDIEWGYR